MAFDETKMKVFYEAEGEADDGRGTLVARLFSWEGGPQKISLARKIDRDGEPGFAKLGGMTLAEGEVACDVISECLVNAGAVAAPAKDKPKANGGSAKGKKKTGGKGKRKA